MMRLTLTGVRVELRLLGPVEVWAEGRRIDAGQPRQRSVLAVLSADAGRPVPVDTVVDRVWDDVAPRGARHALHGHITRIRRVLKHSAEPGRRPATVVFAANCYRLDTGDATVDLQHFRRLADEA